MSGGFFENLLGNLGLVGGGAGGLVGGAALGSAAGAGGGTLIAPGVGTLSGAAAGAFKGGAVGATVGAATGYLGGKAAGGWIDQTGPGQYVNQKVDDLKDWINGDKAADDADAKADTESCKDCPCSRIVMISRGASPQAAQHIVDAQAAGYPSTLTLDRPGTDARRAASLRGIPIMPKMDRDEYPPATFTEGGAGSSVRHIPRNDNRSAGGQLGAQLNGVPEGCKITIRVGP